MQTHAMCRSAVDSSQQVGAMHVLTLAALFAFATMVLSRHSIVFDDTSLVRTHIMMLVPSIASSTDRRNSLRKRFAQDLNQIKARGGQQSPLRVAVLKFVIGGPHVDLENEEDLLFVECADSDSGDQWGLPSFEEAGFSATTQKVILSTRWAVAHYDFDYLARIGDDAYFRLHVFYQMVFVDTTPAFPREQAYIGYVQRSTKDDLKRVHGEWAHHVGFVNGGGWIITADAAHFIASNYQTLKDAWPEDVVVAMWFLGTKVNTVHSDLFLPWRPPNDPCDMRNNTLLMHYMRDEHWNSLTDEGMLPCPRNQTEPAR